MKHFEELKLLLENDNPDIIGISETKLDETINDSDIKISNYNTICKDRDKFGGGVVMYIRESLHYKLRDDLDFDIESISAKVKVGNFGSFLVTSLYRPPKKPVEYFDRIEALISATEADRKESIIIRDTNCDFLCDNSNDTRNLKRILGIYGFTQVIKDPTRTTLDSKTIIDHIITNRTDLVRNCGVVHCGISDHDALFLQKNMRKPKLKLSSKTIITRNYKHFDRAAFLNDIKMAHFDQIKNYTSDANEMWALWKKLFLDILNKHAPMMNFKIKGKNMPYITSDLKQMIRQRDYLKAKAVKQDLRFCVRLFVK